MNRKRKKVEQYGKQNQQDRLSRIEYGAGVINTKYGTLGVKVQSGQVRERGRKEERIRKVKKKMKKIGLRKSGGRNNKGRITVRHRGGGSKRMLRELEYVSGEHKIEVGGVVERLEYDPNRTAYVGVCRGQGGREVYKIIGGEEKGKSMIGKEIRAVRVKEVEVGGEIYKVSVREGQEGKIARAAGAKCKIIKIEGKDAVIRLPSGKVGKIKASNTCYRGEVKGEEQVRMTKAGTRRRLGERPRVRGVAMNAVDHPHGGKTPSGQATTKWGKLAK